MTLISRHSGAWSLDVFDQSLLKAIIYKEKEELMKTVIWLLIIIACWYTLNRWVFPKLGIQG